jgi:hypothetical protein
MKENARLSSTHARGVGAMQVVAKHVAAAMAATKPEERARWELHVVAHSAGAIYAAHALPHLLGCGIPMRSFHLMAPAATVGLYHDMVLPAIQAGACPVPDTYVLSDAAERGDSVGPYGKSLLYLVSNAFEPRRATPLLGMERFVALQPGMAGPDAAVAKALAPGLVVAGQDRPSAPGKSAAETHGGFDNDPVTMNSILARILGSPPPRPFEARDMVF